MKPNRTPSLVARVCCCVAIGVLLAGSGAVAATETPDRPTRSGGNGSGGGRSGGGPGSGRSASSSFKLGGTRTLSDGSTKTESSGNYTSSTLDVSAVYVTQKSSLTLIDPTITTTGNSSSTESSSFYGLNAAVLAGKGATVTITGGTIRTTGTGANGVFATDSGSTAILSKVRIEATGGGGHGVMVSARGTMRLTDVDIVTSGPRAAAIATDRGSGTIDVTGGTARTSGQSSPGLYSTGVINVTNATITATGAQAAVIEGSNSIVVNNSTLSGAGRAGVMIYQSFSGDAEGRKGVFTMTGGSLTATAGPVFFVTNSTGVVSLTGVEIVARSGILLKASIDRWGRSGSNGGRTLLSASGENLTGDVVSDALSSIAITLQKGSTLSGSIKTASLTLDATSTWHVTGDSVLSSLTVPAGATGPAIANIHGHGHTVAYDAKLAENKWLEGRSYTLAEGGQLTPAP